MKSRKIDEFKVFINALETKSKEHLISIIDHIEKDKVDCKGGMLELFEEMQGLCRDILEGREKEAAAV